MILSRLILKPRFLYLTKQYIIYKKVSIEKIVKKVIKDFIKVKFY